MPKFDIYENKQSALLVAEKRIQNFAQGLPGNIIAGDVNSIVHEFRKKVNIRPLVYFWIVEFSNGIAIAQFDPATGRENSFGEEIIPRSNLINKAGWYPFSERLLGLIDYPALVLPLPIHRVDIQYPQQLMIFRRNRVHYSGSVSRGKVEYFLGVKGKVLKRIFENGNSEDSIDYPQYGE